MKISRRPDDEMGFQLAPMIDMTFLLLIFFMVTTKISKEQIKEEIKLPVASSAVIPKDLSNRDIVSIDNQGSYFIGNEPTDKKKLAAYLKKRFENTPPLRLYIRADKTTPAKKIKEVMKMAADAGAVDVIFGSYQS
ncbi:MAG: biopolymer transporter ExbD [Chthoniobacterales bacterium]|jgi:biopolymer transport protein ExbD|nr:biopolymer transporter ExbD [Chthoniobacterales bacterium]